MIRSLVLLKNVSVLGSEDPQFLEGVTLASLSFGSWVPSSTAYGVTHAHLLKMLSLGGVPCSRYHIPPTCEGYNFSKSNVLTQAEQELLRNKEKRILQHPSAGEPWVKGAPLGTF